MYENLYMLHMRLPSGALYLYVNLNVNVKLELTLDYEKFTKFLWVPEYRRTWEWWTKKWDRFFWENCHPVAAVFRGISNKCKHIWLYVKDMTLTQQSPIYCQLLVFTVNRSGEYSFLIYIHYAKIIFSSQCHGQKKGKINE